MGAGAYSFGYLDRVKHGSLNDIVCDSLNAAPGGIFGTGITAGANGIQCNGPINVTSNAALANTHVVGKLTVTQPNGDEGLYIQRGTDTSPSGWLIYCNNFAGTDDIFSVDVNGGVIAKGTLSAPFASLSGGGGSVLNVTNGGITVAGQSTFTQGINANGTSAQAIYVPNGGISTLNLATTSFSAAGVANLNGGANVAGGLTVTSGGLNVIGPIVASGGSSINANLTVAGSLGVGGDINTSSNFGVTGTAQVNGHLSAAGGNVVLDTNGVAYFGTTHEIGFEWDGTNLQGYVDRTSIGPLVLASGGSSPTFGDVHVTNNLTVDGTTNFTANGVNAHGGISIVSGGFAVGDGATSNFTGQIICSGGSAEAILANNGGIWAVGNVTAYNGNVTLGPYGMQYMGGDQFAFTWSGSTGAPGNVNLYVDNNFEGYVLFSGDIVYVERNTMGGGPTGQAMDFLDGGGTTYRCYVDTTSDERLKLNIRDTQVDALAAVLAMPVRAFEWNDAAQEVYGYQTGVAIGLVAQEANVHMPGIASPLAGQPNPKLPPDQLFINYDAAVPYLIRAIQQLQAEVEALKRRN